MVNRVTYDLIMPVEQQSKIIQLHESRHCGDITVDECMQQIGAVWKEYEAEFRQQGMDVAIIGSFLSVTDNKPMYIAGVAPESELLFRLTYVPHEATRAHY